MSDLLKKVEHKRGIIAKYGAWPPDLIPPEPAFPPDSPVDLGLSLRPPPEWVVRTVGTSTVQPGWFVRAEPEGCWMPVITVVAHTDTSLRQHNLRSRGVRQVRIWADAGDAAVCITERASRLVDIECNPTPFQRSIRVCVPPSEADLNEWAPGIHLKWENRKANLISRKGASEIIRFFPSPESDATWVKTVLPGTTTREWAVRVFIKEGTSQLGIGTVLENVFVRGESIVKSLRYDLEVAALESHIAYCIPNGRPLMARSVKKAA